MKQGRQTEKGIGRKRETESKRERKGGEKVGR